jgi:lipooligosaccharide transport system permease protein
MSTPTPARTAARSSSRLSAPALRRIEPAAVGAVVFRELTMYRRYWKSTTFSSVVEPTIYLLAFGFGFGSLVAQVAGYDYVDFVGTGIVATAVLFSSAFPGMFGTFVKRRSRRRTTRCSRRRSTPRSWSLPRRCGSHCGRASTGRCRW